MEVTLGAVALRRGLVPSVDEPGALLQGVVAERQDLEFAAGACGRYASLIRFARGPFWLGSISKLTRSPPARESKFTLESRPVRWKKYSFPSSAAMKPKPRSETSFLMVPVGIYHSSSRK